MTTLHHILSIAHSGLQASQSTVALASNNIANVDTPGYARQIQPLSAAFGGLGVASGAPFEIRNMLLERSLAATTSRLGFHQQEGQLLSQVEAAVNDLDGNGVQSSLRAFESSLTALSANPGGSDERAAVLAAAEALSGAFGTARQQFVTTREQAVAEADVIAREASQLTAGIAELNGRIAGARGGDASALISRRSAMVQELSDLVGVETVQRSDGSLHLHTAGGRPLVESSFPTTIRVQTGPPPDNAPQVVFEKPNGDELFAMGPVGGRLGGAMETIEETLGPGLEKLDAMAYHFMDAFNAAHGAGYGLTGGTGYDFFELPASERGAAASMTLSADVDGFPEHIAAAASAATVPGGNENVLTLSRLIGQPGVLPSGESVEGAFRNLATDVTRNLTRARQSTQVEQASHDQIQNLLASEQGVNIDEEMIRVTQANAALNAANTMLSQSQEMTATILSMVQ